MSQSGSYATSGVIPPGGAVVTVTGNTGGAVGPDGSNNLNIIGSGNISVAGNAGTHTETITLVGTTNNALQVGSASGALSSLALATNGQIPIGSTGNAPTIATLTAGSGISITNGAGSITITATGGGGGFSWTEDVTTSISLAVNNGYISNNASPVTATLPASAAVGDYIRIMGKGSGLVTIAQNSGQTVHFNANNTTTGAGGSLTALAQWASLEILCTTADTDFAIVGSVGNWTVV